MSGSVSYRRGARLAAVCAPAIFAFAACSPSDESAVVLEPLYCRADCEHCDSTALELIDSLPMPPPRERREPVQRGDSAIHRHRVVVEVRSHEGVPAANARVDLWQHRRHGDPVRAGHALTDVDGIALIPFEGRGVYCVHAEHDQVGSAALAPRQLRLSNTAQDWSLELVLPKSDVVLERAGVVQIGVAAPDGSPLALSRVAIWRHEFGADESMLAGTGLTDEAGVVRIELERPALYAVAAAHADYASDSLEYIWFVPRSPRSEARSAELSEERVFVECDAHLRLGPDAPGGLVVPFHEHHLGPEDDIQVTEAPACCRSWSRDVRETAAVFDATKSRAPVKLASTRPRFARKHVDPPAVDRPAAEVVPPFSSGSTAIRAFDGDALLDSSKHATVRHE